MNNIIEDVNDLKNQTKYIEKVKSILADKEYQKGSSLCIYVGTFGCQQNEADSEKILGTAINLGYIKTSEIEKADLIVFNTCAVREHAELKALSKTGELKHLKEKNPDLLIGLWGCMVSQEHRKEDIKKKYPFVDFVAGTNMLHRFPEILCDVLMHSRRRYYVDNTPHTIVEGLTTERESDIKAWLSIMYGCNNFCTYCVVPYVRGRERSRLPENVLAEAVKLSKDNYKEITLLGQNVNSYGLNLPNYKKINFAELLRRVCDIDGDFWVRFMTSHPKDASDELIQAMKENSKAAKHFHLPMQSGSNEILNRMNRKYTREEFLNLALKIKSEIPQITLTTDIICGFPGESEKDFLDTLDMVEKVKFESIYSFNYSPRVGTPAAKMDNQVPPEEKIRRFTALSELQSKISAEINASYVGKTVRVLIDTHKVTNQEFWIGRSEGYKNIKFTSDKNTDLYGKFVDVLIDKNKPSGIFGKTI